MKSNIEKVKALIELNQNIGRYSVMSILNVKEHEARALLEEARGQAPKNLIPIMKIACFDLETTNLKPDIGRLLCGSIYSYPDGEMITMRNDDYVSPGEEFSDDKRLSVAIRDKLEEYHVVVGWYSKGFDIPFLNTRLVQNGERRIIPQLHVDPMWYHKGWRGIKPISAKLSSVANFYGLDEHKMEVPPAVWAKAHVGDRASLDIICERCESDVRILAEITARTFDAGLVKHIQMYP